MLLASPFIILGFAWAAIHGVHRFFRQSRTQSLLPLPLELGAARRDIWHTSTTEVILKILHLRVQTTALNPHHDLLIRGLARKRRAFLARSLRLAYDFGCVLGVLGMLGGEGFLLWTCGEATLSMLQRFSSNASQNLGSETASLVRRGFEAHASEQNPYPRYEPIVRPLIPGITVPFAHLSPILVAIFLAQIVHELGHAVAAAVESLPIASAGASFTVMIPSAFVTFPSAALESLSRLAHLRVIAAGPFHNVLLWCFLISVRHAGIGRVLWSAVGYRDMSALGIVVVGVDPGSPLNGYLLPGSTITKLDDTILGSLNTTRDIWTSYLTMTDTTKRDMSVGWCVGLLESPELCCSNITASSRLSCFASMDVPAQQGCLDPVPILTVPGDQNRCNSVADCGAASICAQPDERERLLRLTVHHHFPGEAAIVLWSGSKEEILAEVEIGTLLPRFGFLPIWLPVRLQVFWEYLTMGTLSLFFFNLLPVPYLDGSQFLTTILRMTSEGESNVGQPPDEYDLEASVNPQGRRRGRRHFKWRETSEILIPKITVGLIIMSTLLAVINLY